LSNIDDVSPEQENQFQEIKEADMKIEISGSSNS
jgi:hypothetical protein